VSAGSLGADAAPAGEGDAAAGRSRVSEGHTLAYALAEYPQVFSEMYRAMVAAGEHAGFLGPVLEQLADYAEQRQHSSQKLKMAMIYPFILLGVAVAVIVSLDGVRGAGAGGYLCAEQPGAAAADRYADCQQ
jgi:hypothetical protein